MEKEKFTAHPLWETLKSVEDLISQVDVLGDEAISEELEEARRVCSYSVAISETDQLFLIGVQLMDELNSAWSQVGSSLSTYLQNPAAHGTYLDNATGPNLDAVRTVLGGFVRPDEAGAKKAASTRAGTAYIEQVDEARRLLVAQIKNLKEERDRMAESHAEENASLTNLIESLKSQISTLSSRIDADETRISSALTESNEAFNKSQSERQERFGKWLEQQGESFNETAHPYFESIMAADAKAQKAFEEIETLRTSVVDMASLASGDILGDQYKKSAHWDRVAGYIGYGVGVLAGVAGVLILLFAFGEVNAGLEWTQVALKLGLTTGIGGVATVAFRFGGQSLARATAFKRQELELRALTPFLNGVEGSDDAKLTFVRQAFGRAWVAEHNSGTSAEDSNTHSELLKALQSTLEIANKLSK